MSHSIMDKADELLKLRREMAVLIKINNLTGFLPVNLENLLQAIMKEMDHIFFPYQSSLHLFQDGQLKTCCELIKDNLCKAFQDQLPVILDPGESLCCQAVSCTKCYESHICVPLVAGIEKIGVVTLKSKQHVEFDRDSMELLLAIANQMAATIQRARLFSRLAEEKANLEKANKAINGLNQELQRSIKKLKQTQDQLVISERLAAAGQVSANLAHEINNPISVISSRLEWLLLEANDYGLPQEVIKDLEVVLRHTERIARTTRGLLSFSRRTIDHMVPLDVNSVVIETTEWLSSQFARHKINFSLKLQEIPLISGNPEQIEQVLVNLLTNAKDAMPEGGEIVIRSSYDRESEMVQLDVIDSGTGIPDEIKPRIFDPFFTTKEKNVGTGLGLSVSYGIIESHGGQLKVESRLGEGSCFRILLPAISGDKKG